MDKMLSIEEGSRVKGRIDTNRLKKELEEAISHVLVDKVYTRGDCEERGEDEADDGGGASSCGGLPLLMGPVGSRLLDGRYKSRPTITGSLCAQS